MTITVEQLRPRVGATGEDEDTAALTLAVNAAMAQVDRFCHRQFAADAEPTARTFVVTDPQYVSIDDISDPEGVEVDSPASGWELWPLTPPPGWAPTWPRTELVAATTSFNVSGLTGGRVTINAKWGCPYEPPDVEMAQLLQATRLYKRKDSPEGVAGSNDWGIVRIRPDSDVGELLASFVRVERSIA